jgi:hypothetical protein
MLMLRRQGHDYVSIFLVSAGALSIEVVLTRIFAVSFWHHFSSLLIALALTGFGCAGSLLALAMPRLEKWMPVALMSTALSAALTTVLAYLGVLALKLEPLSLAWSGRAWLELSLVCVLLIIPFLTAAAHIALVLARAPRPRLAYGLNLAGSGAGCLIAALSLAYLLPQQALYPGVGLILFGFIAQAAANKGRARLFLALLAAGLALLLAVSPLPLDFAAFKDRSAALAAKGSRIGAREVGIRAVVEVIGGPAFHHASGLSLSCPAPLPEQLGLFGDGDLLGPISKARAADTKSGFVSCLLASLPAQVFQPRSALTLNPQGGLSLLCLGEVPQVTAVLENPQVSDLMTGPLAGFSKNVYQRPGLNLIREDPSLYLTRERRSFDLILWGQGIRWGGGSATGLGVSRLLTVGGLKGMLDRLSPNGVLAIMGPLLRPPRASLKLLLTAGAALRQKNLHPASRLAIIRDWNTVLILVKPGGFTAQEALAIKTKAEALSFDIPALPGWRPDDLPRFHRLPGEPLARAWSRLRDGREKELLGESLFDLKPATRDRPYFFHFFRPATLGLIMNPQKGRGLAVTQWGSLFIWGSLAATLGLALIGILLPLYWLRPRPPGSWFFACLGLGYMLAEITLLAEAIFILGRPALSVPLVVGTFLLASGLGSCLWGHRRPAGFALLSALALLFGFGALRLAPMSEAALALALIPAALVMGAPFAGGLFHLSGPSPRARAWAFGINGFFSVAGSLTATLICLHAGHTAAIIGAVCCYLLAAYLARGGNK